MASLLWLSVRVSRMMFREAAVGLVPGTSRSITGRDLGLFPDRRWGRFQLRLRDCSAPCVRGRALGQSHASRASPPARRLSPSLRRLRGVAAPPPNKARRPRFLPFQSALFVFRLRHPCRPSGHQDVLLLFPAEGFAGSPFTLRSPVPRALRPEAGEVPHHRNCGGGRDKAPHEGGAGLAWPSRESWFSSTRASDWTQP